MQYAAQDVTGRAETNHGNHRTTGVPSVNLIGESNLQAKGTNHLDATVGWFSVQTRTNTNGKRRCLLLSFA